ncbi:Oidioi.mRNA.OKI2018_I69.PAR.g12705.t1.cds [Oikopleura dioica]|uniref:Oidioi.mRNA.OKI2018_I69.PAR.g12705.t1.cds n=1 Tax=Oikopleura dioica TaxID=34765 RepID=A0ABN7S7I9_OIKDI|nr:Oidioi.mRNA.OKI2018_I69.PAR.g12705.t1.cds [Oikopleura dioica]
MSDHIPIEKQQQQPKLPALTKDEQPGSQSLEMNPRDENNNDNGVEEDANSTAGEPPQSPMRIIDDNLLLERNHDELRVLADHYSSNYEDYEGVIHEKGFTLDKNGIPTVTQEGLDIIQILEDGSCGDPICELKHQWIQGVSFSCDKNVHSPDYPQELYIFYATQCTDNKRVPKELQK